MFQRFDEIFGKKSEHTKIKRYTFFFLILPLLARPSSALCSAVVFPSPGVSPPTPGVVWNWFSFMAIAAQWSSMMKY